VTYRIEVTASAARALGKLDPPVARRSQGVIELLAIDPRPPASTPLRGRPGYRVRVGDHRIIYTVADDVLLVVEVVSTTEMEQKSLQGSTNRHY
jgi:mRNA interferase RelE/StbE